MPYKDIEKQRQAQRESVKRRREKVNAAVQKRRMLLKSYVNSKKDHPCVDCGGSFPPFVMDFHHVRGDKVAAVSMMANERRKIEEIDAEMAKCVLVCANCHRVRHGGHGDVL